MPKITVLIAPANRSLQDQLAEARPDLDIHGIGMEPVPARLTAPLFAFVDWLLPDMSGLEFCRRLRDAESSAQSPVAHAHVTMVLESGDAGARRRALAAGADDYLVGPLTLPALLERIDGAELSVARPTGWAPLRLGELSVDVTAFQARFRGRILPLRPNEFRLLVHFMENPDQVFSRTALIDRLGKDGDMIDERTVDVWIGRLRRALRAHGVPDPLRTVRSLGYVLDSLPPA
ncbi:winged helix-turn-helix domain-containing protein [Novosphingobium flavum]|uniref:Winged helix-turn-helix domain-containing protein n=1 Tax=Novosphingobium aerophilum TaxID=2839843 RepID=A0A7X1KBN4_9SPHN|nr:response regulator transcription factor [Novosphingobium aerophilum]MBC2651247.1 winged helix-turn-helix domain-containing protein [Novosphingobium aerophilum]MBC2660804.1 winged helix-turn-helix domain-containing protein [Novosphingobium aerophilum]